LPIISVVVEGIEVVEEGIAAIVDAEILLL
jgi:hypothetical protein